MKSAIILVLGLLVTAVGLLFLLQGANVVRWPAESFMIGHHEWIEYGVVIMMLGGALILTARRIRRP